MDQYRLYDAAIKEWTSSLSPWHAILYALCVCRRSAPLYFEFAAKEEWGDVKAFKASHRFLKDYLFAATPNAVDLAECKTRVEGSTPHTEEFPSGDYACNTGIIHSYALSLLDDYNSEHAYYIARYCYELVDSAAYKLIQPKGGDLTSDIERQIQGHPLVQKELLWQSKGRQRILEIPKDNAVEARRFIKFWTAEPIVRTI